ncbi:MAG TPA: hypothetical protein VEY13_08270 [Rubrobacteraceae bacterium]|nr:hypothetical protein [Rubrobacteraceae bacterium]
MGRFETVFVGVSEEAIFTCEYCIPGENDRPGYVGGDLRMPLL